MRTKNTPLETNRRRKAGGMDYGRRRTLGFSVPLTLGLLLPSSYDRRVSARPSDVVLLVNRYAAAVNSVSKPWTYGEFEMDARRTHHTSSQLSMESCIRRHPC